MIDKRAHIASAATATQITLNALAEVEKHLSEAKVRSERNMLDSMRRDLDEMNIWLIALLDDDEALESAS